MPPTSQPLPWSCPVLYTKGTKEPCKDTLQVLWTKRSSAEFLNVPVMPRRGIRPLQAQTIPNIQGNLRTLTVLAPTLHLYSDSILHGFMNVPPNGPRTPGVSIYVLWIQIQIEHFEKYMRGLLVTHHWLRGLKSTVPEVSFIFISSLPWSSLQGQMDQDWFPSSAPLVSHNWIGRAWSPYCCWNMGSEIWLVTCHLPRSKPE